MSLPFFSIIIPTRNRYETLKYTLLTVLTQGYKDFELIISDNSDPENLSELSLIDDYLSDARVKYYRPDSVLSMSDNWEFAVSKAIGNYLIIFGDDDGLVMDSLSELYAIIQKTNSDIVSWARIEYSWPDRKPEKYANLMVIPYKGKTGIMEGRDYIKRVIAYKADYRYLPMFYNSAINKKVVATLKEKTGRVFNSACPDIYSGYAFAYLQDNYISVGYPLSINGVSSKSNGAAHDSADESVKVNYWNTFKSSSIKWPASIPQINTAYLGIAEPFIQASNFFPEIKSYTSRKKIYQIIINNLESTSEEDLNTKIEKILDSAKDDQNLHKWLISYFHKIRPRYSSSVINDYEDKIGFDGSHLILDGSKFGLQNVYDVSVFIKRIFGNLKDKDFLKPVSLPLSIRIRKAAGMIIRKG